MDCHHISACGDAFASETLVGAGTSDARAVGRSGEAPCWRTISCTASPLPNIDTKAAWSDGRQWRWAYARDESHTARVSPRVLMGISTYFSCANSRLTRGEIGAGEFDIDIGGRVVGGEGVGAGAGTGIGDAAGAGAGGTGAGAGAATLDTGVSIGT